MDKIKFETEIVFGKDSIMELPRLVKENNIKNVLITYGGGSIKRNGILQKAIEILNNLNVNYAEFGGIKPNPRHTTIDRAAELAKKEKIDFILAIGGGSTIDASKVIAAKTTNDWESSWDFVKGKMKMTVEPLPLGAILTLSGTGSENNNGSVVTNEDDQEKRGVLTKAPIFAIEDPTYTYTVNAWQTSSGSFDILSHLLEQFFGANPFDFSDNQIIGMMKTLIKNVPIALKNPQHYAARESLMITSSFALNRVLNFKIRGGDWFVHQLEHAFSAIWDISHGAGLATISYWYYEYAINTNDLFRERAKLLAIALFNKEKAEDFASGIRSVINEWDLPNKFSDYNSIQEITDLDIQKILVHTINRGPCNINNNQLTKLIKSAI